MITIGYIDPIWCRVNKEGRSVLNTFLNYPYTFYRQGPHHKITSQHHHPLVAKDGRFLTGFLPRVFETLKNRNIPYQFDWDKDEERIILRFRIYDKAGEEMKPSFTLRPEQQEAIELALINRRGVIHYPTGSGKTVIFLTIIEQLPEDANVLILLYHDKTLFDQTYNRALELFPGQVGAIGYGAMNPNRITIANTQTFGKLPLSEFHRLLNVVMVDECHHVSSFKGEFYNILTSIPAPIRLGFTGTLPYTPEGKMALEGLIGSVIAEKQIKEVPSLAKPIIKVKMLPFNQSVHDLKSWRKVYSRGVVFNSRRHRQTLTDAQELVVQGRSVLILVVEIKQGEQIMKMAEKMFPQLHKSMTFIYGGTPGDQRTKAKKLLEQGYYKAIVANVVWREGIDIPNLGAIINACGGKSEIMTIQALGRGLRTTEGKKDVVLVDYFDPSSHYLVDHFGHRLCLYFEEGWI